MSHLLNFSRPDHWAGRGRTRSSRHLVDPTLQVLVPSHHVRQDVGDVFSVGGTPHLQVGRQYYGEKKER